MTAVYQRADGVATAKIADLRLRVRAKHVPAVAPTGLWLDLVVTHPTVRGHIDSYFNSAQELKKDALLAATQKEELKAKRYATAFPALPAAAFKFFGFGLDVWSVG
jgi:hypothetical protein